MSPAEGGIEVQMYRAIRSGADAAEATTRALAPLSAALEAAGSPALSGYARPAVLRAVRRVARLVARQEEDRAFGAAPGSAERGVLGGLVFHLPDGTEVAWARAGCGEHEQRAAWLRTYMATLAEDVARHERALKLLADRGAARLAEVGGWEDLIGDDSAGGAP